MVSTMTKRSAVLIVALALGACGGVEPRPGITEITSAKLDAQRSEAAQVARERDEARANLAAEKALVQQQATQRAAADAASRKARDELATKAWNALDNADDELLPLKEKASSASASNRAQVEAVVDEAMKKKGHVKANLKALTTEQPMEWENFKTQTEQAITALDEAVRAARAQLTTLPEEPAKPGKARAAAR